MALLEVTDLKTYFKTDDGIVKAVDGVTFSVEKGKTLGIVGESGCGKSVTCLTIMGLNPKRTAITSGQALFKGNDLLIADEPTTALDVTTQAQILNLMNKLRQDFGSAIIMITHDLGVVAETADDVVVMYAARIQEEAVVDNIFAQPQHPYTWGLLGSLPRLDQDVERLVQITGQPPSLLFPPRGCRFHPRCSYVMSICKEVEPELEGASDNEDHRSRCHLGQDVRKREISKLLKGMMADAS